MIARSPHCFRAGKKARDVICSAGEIQSLALHVRSHTTWGKTTSKRPLPPQDVLERLAREMKCSVEKVRRMWEERLI
jgi:hypothetical protein